MNKNRQSKQLSTSVEGMDDDSAGVKEKVLQLAKQITDLLGEFRADPAES